ncbi:MAG: hypothetical protein V3V33_10335, partial [Candidatus Lokiarchaeia archaeon]
FLDSSDSYVTFYETEPYYRNRGYGTVNTNTTATYSSNTYWRFTVSDTAPANHDITFSIRITDNSGYQQTFTKTLTAIEGTIPSDGDDDDGDGNGSSSTGFPPIDWSLFGLGFLIIAGIAVSIGLVYSNHHFHWLENFSKSHKKKKQIKLKEKELEGNKFENLIRKSKELVNKGKEFYSKELFLKAAENWNEAINYYSRSIKKGPSSQYKAKINETINILREDICNAYVENGKKHNLIAKKAHKAENIQKAQKEWNLVLKEFQIAKEIIISEKLDIPYDHLDAKLKSINLKLAQLDIEKICLKADSKLEKARSLQNEDFKETVTLVQNSLLEFSDAKKQAEKQAEEHPEFQELIRRIQTKMENTRNFQLELQDKMDELIGITPLTTPVIIEDEGDLGKEMEGTIIKPDEIAKALLIKREHELIGGQIRFKVALINNTRTALTALKISFDIPDALKWIMYEPKYERKGDSILIPKLSINEKKTVSLYLEPINCLNSPVNATVSFFDAKDRPQAIVMDPKYVSITCPIFFTKEEANLARLKRLQRTLNYHQKKLIPISNIEKIPIIFSTILSVVGKRDIKLVYNDLSVKDKLGEAWFYGVTKVKEKRHVIYILLDGEINTLKLEVSGDNDEHITGFLAEISNEIKQELLKHKVISVDERFYNMSCSVLIGECPFCGAPISAKLVEKYEHGESINCIYCGKLIPNINKI